MLYRFRIMAIAADAKFRQDAYHFVPKQWNFACRFAIDARRPQAEEAVFTDHGATAIEFLRSHVVEVRGAVDGSEAVRLRYKQRFCGTR